MCWQRSCQFLKNFVSLEPGYALQRNAARGPPFMIVNPPHENALNCAIVGISGSFEGLGIDAFAMDTGAFTTGGPFGIAFSGATSSGVAGLD